MERFKFCRVTLLVIALWLSCNINAFSQNNYSAERIHIQCDKQLYQAGDTIWWKGYIIAGGHFSGSSTNLHVELFNDTKQLIDRELFPVINGQAIGQMALPDSLPPGNYWLRFFTKYRPGVDSGDIPVIPITIYREQDKNRVFMVAAQGAKPVANSEIVEVNADTLNAEANGYNSWRLTIKDSSLYHVSCSVTDADRLPGVDKDAENKTGTEKNAPTELDTSFIQVTGTAYTGNGQKLGGNNKLMAMLMKDSTLVMTALLPIDSDGRFTLRHLFFFGKEKLMYQLNTSTSGAKDVTLVLDSYQSPPLNIPLQLYQKDTLQLQDKFNKADNGEIKGKQLKEVVIKTLRAKRQQLDRQYSRGAFSEPTLNSFDLREEKHYIDLANYLNNHLAGFEGDNFGGRPLYNGSPNRLLFYLDEQLKGWGEVRRIPLSDIAYIKAFESDLFEDSPRQMIVSIYLRRGKDIQSPPGLNTIVITGYSPIAKFNSTDKKRLTLLWRPLIDANNFRIRFNNNGITKHFRITIKGFNDDGREIEYTTVLPKEN